MNSDERLYETVMNDIPKNPVNIAGNILVCNRGCNLRWTLGEIDSFTIVKNGTHLLLKNLMHKGKPISAAFNRHLVTFNGGANGYSDKNYVLSSISINFPSVLYHGGSLASGDMHLIFKAADNSNLMLVLIVPTEADKGHGVSDMTKQDIDFFAKVVKNIPSKHENNHADVTGINGWSVDMLLPKKGTESGKDHSFYSFVSPENSNICYIYFQHPIEITDTLLHAVVGKKGTPSYNAYLKKAQERWVHPNPDNMVIFGNRDIPSETMDEMQSKLRSGNVKCNVRGNYAGGADLSEGRMGDDGVAVPVTGKSENIVNIYIDDNSSGGKKGGGSEKKGSKKKSSEIDEIEDEDEEDSTQELDTGDNNYCEEKHYIKIILIILAIVIFLIVIGLVINYYKDKPNFMGKMIRGGGNMIRGGLAAIGIGKTVNSFTSVNYIPTAPVNANVAASAPASTNVPNQPPAPSSTNVHNQSPVPSSTQTPIPATVPSSTQTPAAGNGADKNSATNNSLFDVLVRNTGAARYSAETVAQKNPL